MTMIPQKDVYKKEKKKKRVFIEKIEEETNYKELFEKILKKKKRENGKEKANQSFREALYFTVYQDMGEKGTLKNPHGWLKLDF